MEASIIPKQAQHFSTCRKVQDGNSRVHQNLPHSRGMGCVDRSIGRLPPHPHPSSLKEIPKILPQVSGVPVHLPTFRTGHSPPGLYHDRKGGEAHGPLQRSQTAPIPGRLAGQVSVVGGSPREHSGSGRSNPVLGMDHQSGEIRTESHSGVFARGLRVPPGFSPCKTHSREMAQTSGFYPTSQVKTCFDCKMFDVSNWVASLNGENGPRGTTLHEAFQFYLKEHWKFPQPLDSRLPWTEAISAHLDWWQNPANVMKGSDLHPKDHSIQLFTDASNKGWGAHLEQSSTQGLWSPQEKGLHINVLELKAVFLALRRFKDQCQDQTVLVATDNSTVVAYINKQGGTHSAEMCALLWRIMTWCHHSHITLKARHIPGCLNVMADLLSRSNQVQSTEWSLHPQVFKQICQRWFTPHVDLFATYLNHKLPLYVSPIPDPKAWDIDALNINWTGLTAYAYLKNQAMQLSDHTNSPRLARDALVLGPSAALNRDPTAAPGVDNTPQAVPQLHVPQQPAAPQPPRLVSRSGQLQEQGFSVEVAERIAAPQRSSIRTIYKSKWTLFQKWSRENSVDFSTPSVKQISDFFSFTCTKIYKSKWALFEKWCRENSVDFSNPSVKQISDFFMYLYQDLNRRPSTIDGYRNAIVDTLGPLGQHIAHNEDLHRLLSSFHRDHPKSSRNLPKWNLSVVLNELTKAPFEPMKDTDLKHLTLKIAFLLALASGKRRSEIHAWVANKVSNLGQWEKVALFPSSDFIAKNQLAREGSQSVSLVTIPALTTILDRQFK